MLYANDALDGWVALVVFQCEVFVLEGEYVFHVGVDAHCRKRVGGALQLRVYLFQMIEIDVRVAQGVYEYAGFVAAYLRNHHCE